MKTTVIKYWGCVAALCGMLCTTACSDEPDAEHYYTFKGQMMSEYLNSSEDFSEFATIVERAGLSDMLSSYGSYTCFAPTNEAVYKYLEEKGVASVDGLTDAECDTIARTHLIENMYSTSEMNDGVLPTQNMNRRYLEIGHGNDENGNAVVLVNKTAHVIFELQDDSVENGIMQPVTEVLQNSNNMLPQVLQKNDKISTFYAALVATGLIDSLTAYRDDSWDPTQYERYYYTSHVNKETATVPDEKRYGFTLFIPKDEVLQQKYGIAPGDVRALYDLACQIYDATYPKDAAADYHGFDQLTHRKNPLNRFIAYHILTRDVKGWNYLTPLNDIGIETAIMNPEDWYETMLPRTMIKVEKLTVWKYANASGDQRLEIYLNRRYDDYNSIHGAMVSKTVETEYEQEGLNGRYFYINDYIAFSEQTRDIVHNCRIRMDFSTIFPELMTNDIRQNGNPDFNDPEFDETAKYGRNYYFPNGYLKDVTTSGGYFIYRRPRSWYTCYEGDEMNMFGDYDITFKLPPVPFESDYQIRLGFCCTDTRGIGQVYFDGIPQGIPLDMTKALNDPTIAGSSFRTDYTTGMTEEEKQEERKALKNKGYYRGPRGGYHLSGTSHAVFANDAGSYRIVLCTVHIDPDKDHYLRCRNVSDNGSTEFMLDFLEIVPKSVYGVEDEEQQEDDL